MFSDNLFAAKTRIDPTCEVVFVSDYFPEDYVGGAELTSQALIDESPYKVHKLHSRDVNMDALKDGHEKFWIFGNFAQLNPNLIPTIVANMKYSVLEYDFKYCKHRSPEKHKIVEGNDCDCHSQMNGKIVSAFFHGSRGVWWMSEKQMQHYHSLFPFLASKSNTVLSSIFDKSTLLLISNLRKENLVRSGWFVAGSNSWIKGLNDAKQWCEDNAKVANVVWGLKYHDTLNALARSEGFVFLPPGMDTCPRMVIEARLLGCDLVLNDNVLHKDEEWFNTSDLETIESYLLAAPTVFWNGIKSMMEHVPTLSGYVTTYNCLKQDYPIRQCVESLLACCDEVCVLDGGSTDGTLELIREMMTDSKIQLKIVERDWNHPRFAIFDGLQKAEARAMCTQDFCIQMDADEVLHEEDANGIRKLIAGFPTGVELLALPVIEFWGKAKTKVRLDVMPWKWRISRNNPRITHGIPGELRQIDENGDMYALRGTDGCDLIDCETLQRIPFMNFYTQQADQLRKNALLEDKRSLQAYQVWFNSTIKSIPPVFHYSWVDFERKIRLYRDTWTRHWQSLYNMSIEDTPANNMFFEKAWKDVTDDDIKKLANDLEKTGGHIWHTKWNHDYIPHLNIDRSEPASMK